MGNDRRKNTAQWFYTNVFREEAIAPRPAAPAEQLPALLRTARSLESGLHHQWQTRDAIFLKQAKLLAGYEDDYEFTGSVVRYYPTYQSLSDRELRGYFSWRTKLRRGDWQKAPLSFAFLYIYELLNQVGVSDPEEGYRKLLAFRDSYGALDGGILPYLASWLTDYAVYYGLDTGLLLGSPQAEFDRHMGILEDMKNQTDVAIAEAAFALAPKWLSRSKFCAAHKEDFSCVIAGVLRRVCGHYEKNCRKTFLQQYFGSCCELPVYLFESAVFCDPQKRKTWEYVITPRWVYRCHGGMWTVKRYTNPSSPRLETLMKTVDAVMRQEYGDPHPIQCPLDTKWLLTAIREEIHRQQAIKKEGEAERITIDFSRLAAIRSDAEATREKLITPEDMEEDTPAAPVLPDTPLGADEYRLLQCLLYSRPTAWVQAEGKFLSVLTDSINEALFDSFGDCVLDDTPVLIEDYIDELKEMVQP